MDDLLGVSASASSKAALRRNEIFARLAEAPYSFSFYQALRHLDALDPSRPRLGTSTRVADEVVRLGQQPTMDFAPSTLARFTPPQAGHAPRLLSYFFGLFGPNGPLPLHITDYALERERRFRDPTFSRFADLFHHRMMALFYRAWAASEPTVNYDRALTKAPEADRFSTYIASLCGIGTGALRQRDALPDNARLHFAGHFAAAARHPEGLRSMLTGFLRLPVEVKEFVGSWMPLPLSCRTSLGRARETGCLGQGALLGRRVWGGEHKFRLRLGPLSLDDYTRLLPGGTSLPKLRSAVRFYAGDALALDVNLVLKAEEVPPLQLARGAPGLDLLAWTTYLPLPAADLFIDPFTLAPKSGANDLLRSPSS